MECSTIKSMLALSGLGPKLGESMRRAAVCQPACQGEGVLGLAGTASAFVALAMCIAAVAAEFACDGVVFGAQHTAMRAGQHGGGLCGGGRCILRVVGRFGLALFANPPNAREHDQQPNEVFHALRSKITSSTKREPA